MDPSMTSKPLLFLPNRRTDDPPQQKQVEGGKNLTQANELDEHKNVIPP